MIGLTLNEYLYRTDAWNVSLWDLCALREPKHVPRGCKIMENALKELKVNDEYVQMCDVNSYNVLVLCWSQWDSVCTWLLLWTVDVKFLGSWKECVLANPAAPNAGRAKLASWTELTKCMWCLFLLVFTKRSKIHFVEGFDESSWR